MKRLIAVLVLAVGVAGCGLDDKYQRTQCEEFCAERGLLHFGPLSQSTDRGLECACWGIYGAEAGSCPTDSSGFRICNNIIDLGEEGEQ